jgi:hypothetical protein
VLRGSVAIDETDQAAAVEAAFRGIAAVAVGRADQADGSHQHAIGRHPGLARVGPAIGADTSFVRAGAEQDEQGAGQEQARKWRGRAGLRIMRDRHQPKSAPA